MQNENVARWEGAAATTKLEGATRIGLEIRLEPSLAWIVLSLGLGWQLVIAMANAIIKS